jgi:hypothetical protein
MAQHQITLTWNADPDVPSPIPAGDGYNIFKGISPATEGATPINSAPVAALTYVDTAVIAGTTYDYYVTAVVGSLQSAASQQVTATVPLFPVTGLVAVAI